MDSPVAESGVAESGDVDAGALAERLAAARYRLGLLAADLQAELDGIAESTALVPDDEHDAEGSTLGYERARVGGLLQRARHDLAQLEVAVGRLASGDYPSCEGCGAGIGADRLAALPATRRCVRCAALS